VDVVREPILTPAVQAYEDKTDEFLNRRDLGKLTDEEEEVYLSKLDVMWDAMSDDERWSVNRRHALKSTPAQRAEARANFATCGEAPDWLDEP
jgi:hypothetical protein